MSSSESLKTGSCTPIFTTNTKCFRAFWPKDGDRCLWRRSRPSFQLTSKKTILFTPTGQISMSWKIWSTTTSSAANIGKKWLSISGIALATSNKVCWTSWISKTKVPFRLKILCECWTWRRECSTGIEISTWFTSVCWDSSRGRGRIFRLRRSTLFYRRNDLLLFLSLINLLASVLIILICNHQTWTKFSKLR